MQLPKSVGLQRILDHSLSHLQLWFQTIRLHGELRSTDRACSLLAYVYNAAKTDISLEGSQWVESGRYAELHRAPRAAADFIHACHILNASGDWNRLSPAFTNQP